MSQSILADAGSSAALAAQQKTLVVPADPTVPQQPALSSITDPSEAKPDHVSSSAAPISHASLILTALTAGLVLALLNAGIWNAFLVVAVAMLLVCNPWVRTLLELPSTDDKRGLSTFDPARYLLSHTSDSSASGFKGDDDDESAAAALGDDPIMQTEHLYSLTVMPDPLRESSQTMIRFIIRDFVQGWYDPLTFAHPNFPISAEANISHTAASIYLRSRQLKSVNIAAEILLTVQSVLLSSLRRRRVTAQYGSGAASPTRSTWPSTAARVDALRKAVRKLLSRNLAHAERSSPVVMLLLTELLAKQAWQTVQMIGDPDFINQQIVQWAEPASETSLEGQTISPDELDRLNSLNTSALDVQTSEAMQSRTSAVERSSLPDHSSSQPQSASGNVAHAQSLAPNRPLPLGEVRQSNPEAVGRQDANATHYSDDPRSTSVSTQRGAAPSIPPRPRVTPPRKASGSNPFSALGGFATGALGALADVAERAVDVVGGTVDEFGNLLMVPADPSARTQSAPGSGSVGDDAGSPRRRYVLLAERDQVEINARRVNQSRNASGHVTDGSAPAYHLDVPAGIDEPPLPPSLRQSMRTQDGQQNSVPSTATANAFDIPDTPERRSIDAPSIVAPAPVTAALNFASRDSFSIDEDEEDEQASLVAMQHLLSDRGSSAYDAFENFLEQPGNRFCAPNEGESLLRLHTQLNTLASIMEFATLDEQTFRADASSILSKALDQLPSAIPPTYNGKPPVLVRRSAQQVLTNLEWCANMDVVEPLRENIIARLVQLHSAYRASLGGPQQQAASNQPQSAQSSPSNSKFLATLPRTDSPEPNQLRAFLDRENRPSFSSSESDRAAIRYEPRRKTTAPSGQVTMLQPGTQSPPRAPSVPPPGPGGAPVMGPPAGPSRPMSVPPRVPSAPPRPQQIVLPGSIPSAANRSDTPSTQADARSSTDVPRPAASASTVISVTDISANAESGKSVDLRTFEVMISVEGVAANDAASSITSPDGFVLIRRWHEFEQMDAEVQRQPRSSNPLPRLPVARGRRSADVCRLLESYVFELLLPANRAQLTSVAATRRFFDRTRAGASAEDLRRKGGPGAFLGGIGKGIVSGVGMVGKQAAKTGATGVQALSTSTGPRNGNEAAGLAPDGPSPHEFGSTSDALTASSAKSPDGLITRFPPSSPIPDSASSTTSAFVSRTNSPSPSPSRRPRDTATHFHPSNTAPRASSELSARHLDMLLSSIFAVADEAFNLQGGWTLRRGMLRVLEQVVRTTYATSIVAGFNNSAAGLNVDNFAKWISDLTNTMWPNGRRWGSEIGTEDEKQERTEEEKRRTAEKAREIVVSYAPAQAGYLLGPGGKMACVKALAEVHATVMDPITACDLGLTVVLKALDMASR